MKGACWGSQSSSGISV